MAEESEPATAVPEAQVEKPRRERRRLHVPTSVLVTVLVAAFSVWVAPAFTRQWDDRQKEHELKALLVAGIGDATARVLTDGEDALSAKHGDSVRRLPPAMRAWDITGLKIETRLRAYFPAEVVADWRSFEYVVAVLQAYLYERSTLSALQPNTQGWTQLKKPVFVVAWRTVQEAFSSELGGKRPSPLQYFNVEQRILAAQQSVNDAILAAHADGYSTTRRDLLRDLLP
jgi:hypothetical protein